MAWKHGRKWVGIDECWFGGILPQPWRWNMLIARRCLCEGLCREQVRDEEDPDRDLVDMRHNARQVLDANNTSPTEERDGLRVEA